MNSVTWVFTAKAARVFVFGLVSVVTPVYLAVLGYSPLLVGAAIAVMIAGSAFSNLVLVKSAARVGRRRFLMLLSVLMFFSGVLLFATTSYVLILIACFIGNVSTTGTEAGPFQSIEAGVLPSMVPPEQKNRSFGVYNMVGYSASSVGAFAASAPSDFGNSLSSFHSLYLLYGLVGLLLLALYRGLRIPEEPASAPGGLAQKAASPAASPAAAREIGRLSALFSIDAFGGGFVSQSLLVYWFFLVYGVSLEDLGIIFFVVNIITALSTLGASFIADRIGNLRTMVSTHLLSNTFLVLIPFAGSLVAALFFLFARQSVSQMDVPTRQAFMTQIFAEEDRVRAFATTNTSRIISSVFGSPITGALLGAGLAAAPILIGGLSKIAYDGLIFSVYRKRAK